MNSTTDSNMTIIDEELAKRSETYYCICSTAANTSAKVVSSVNSNFELKTGAVINIMFTNGNTTSSVQLNIDSTGAKDARPTTGESTFSDQWESGQVVSFVYNGTYWIYCGGGSGGNNTYYGECSTAAATQAKTVTITGFPTTLKAGLSVRIKFTNAQTYAGAPTLSVNSIGAKTIRRVNGTSAAQYEWVAGEVLDLVYDGTYWTLVDGGMATTDYYGITKLSSSTSSTSTSMAATPSAVKAAYDLADSKQDNITTNGILKGNGSGTISAAIPGTDYQAPLTAGTDYATPGAIPVAATATPVMDSTAAVGNSAKYAREDHVHGSDTSKANLASPTFTGIPAAPTAANGTNTTQLATTAFVQNTMNAKITYGDTDLTAGTSPLANGVIYLMYEVDS